MARHDLDARAQALIARCRALDWRRPRHDSRRAAAAYRRWLALLGMKRRLRWVADPADVAEWRVQAAGMLNAWGALAATNQAAWPAISLSAGPAAPWYPAAPPEMAIAANWASAINLHVAAVDGSPESWFGAWRELAVREPVLAFAMLLLSPPYQWPVPVPAAIALAAPAALMVCGDARTWASLTAAVAQAWRYHGSYEAAATTFVMPAPEELIEALMLIAEPMVEACEAGAFVHQLRGDEIMVLAAPEIWTEDGQLHRAGGPAIAWPRTRLGAWRGFLLPAAFVMDPGIITTEVIGAVTGPLRQALLDIAVHAYDCDVRGDVDDEVEPEDSSGGPLCHSPPGYRTPSSDFSMARAVGCNKR